jgi:CheY-like chemotaxis protein
MAEPLSILMVEDDPHFSRALRTLLEVGRLKTVLTECRTIEGAVATMREQKFDCVLLDLTLPNGRGMQLIDRLLEFPYPLVVITGDGEDATRRNALRHGAQEFITKIQLAKNGPEILARLIENASDRGQGVGHLIGAYGRSMRDSLGDSARE